MDALDVRLVRELGLQPFLNWPRHPHHLKPASLAKTLGLGVDAVKERLRRLEREGIVRGYEIFPNFRHFGMAVSTYRFRLADEGARARAMQDIQGVDGVQAVTGFLGTEICVDVCHRSAQELDRRLGVLSRLLGNATPVGFCEYRLPPVQHDLSPLDWRILQALRGQPRRRLEDVADAVGASARTVKRRFDRMAEAGDFDIVADLDPGALRNSFLALLLVSLRPDATATERATILASIEDRWFFAWNPPGSPAGFCAALLTETMAELEDVRREAESLPGVVQVEARVPISMQADMRWINEAIRERARMPTPREAPPAQDKRPLPPAHERTKPTMR